MKILKLRLVEMTKILSSEGLRKQRFIIKILKKLKMKTQNQRKRKRKTLKVGSCELKISERI